MKTALRIASFTLMTLIGLCFAALILVGGCMRETVTENSRYSKSQRAWATAVPPYAGYLVFNRMIEKHNMTSSDKKLFEQCVEKTNSIGLDGDTSDYTCECHVLDKRDLDLCARRAILLSVRK